MGTVLHVCTCICVYIHATKMSVKNQKEENLDYNNQGSNLRELRGHSPKWQLSSRLNASLEAGGFKQGRKLQERHPQEDQSN